MFRHPFAYDTLLPGSPQRTPRTRLVSQDHSLDPVAAVELRHEASDVALHRGLANEELTSDLRIGDAPGHRGEDLPLGQRVQRLPPGFGIRANSSITRPVIRGG